MADPLLTQVQQDAYRRVLDEYQRAFAPLYLAQIERETHIRRVADLNAAQLRQEWEQSQRVVTLRAKRDADLRAIEAQDANG